MARRFVRAINGGRVDAVVALMAPRHVFIDSLGTRVRGRETLRRGWAAYFGLVPDYRITVRSTAEEGSTVALFGVAGGRYAGIAGGASGKWKTPAAWRAVIRDGLVAEWQVYADNEPLRALMRAARG